RAGAPDIARARAEPAIRNDFWYCMGFSIWSLARRMVEVCVSEEAQIENAILQINYFNTNCHWRFQFEIVMQNSIFMRNITVFRHDFVLALLGEGPLFSGPSLLCRARRG